MRPGGRGGWGAMARLRLASGQVQVHCGSGSSPGEWVEVDVTLDHGGWLLLWRSLVGDLLETTRPILGQAGWEAW